MKQRTTPPGLNDLLDNFKGEIFRDLNCVKIGEIQSYDKATASAQVKIKIKEWIDWDGNKSIAYPIIDDVPIIVLQGGGAWLEFPIAKGDPCLLFFGDRDIDNWWTSGNETTPNSLREHSLSDCMALVGINPKSAALSLSGGFQLWGGSHKLDLANSTWAMSALMASLFSNIDDLFTQITGLMTDLSTLVVVGSPSTQTVAGGPSVSTLAARSANFTTAKTNFDTLKNKFTQLLGA